VAKPEEAPLLPLARSIADGLPIDWAAAEAAASRDEQGVLRQLRILSHLAELHRSLPAGSGQTTHSTASFAPALPAIGAWAHLSLVERLGSGTFGVVYRAWDRRLEREVALKLLRPNQFVEVDDDAQSSRIVREGRLLARVHHSNVITVHGVEVHEDRVGLCMELIRGTTLEALLQTRGPFSAHEASLIGIDLCRALAAIHAAGLIHRDVKAQNVMREDGGRIVLMDLGTGREIDPDRYDGLSDLAGTPLYLAPEIFDGGRACEKTDLYSLGVLLYHIVSGAFPVKATTVNEVREAHAAGTVVRLRDARPDLPTAFVRVVDRAVTADRSLRYATAGALEADLAQALEVSAAPARPEVPVDVPGPSQRWRRAAGAVVLLAATLAIGVFGSARFRSTPAAEAGVIRSIAVLPLTNLSGDASQEYFADGMTDELIGMLGRLGSVKVISRTSAMQFKGSTLLASEIAKALNVDAVIEGSVLIVPVGGERPPDETRHVRINARLIRAGTDTQLWDRTFDKVVSDVLNLQREVAKAVAEGIDLRLTSTEERLLSGAGGRLSRQQDFDAFNLYLKGRYHWNMRTNEGLDLSLRYFQEAINRDPQFAPAYAGQADAYALLPGGLSPFTAYPLAKAAAGKAIALDPTLAEAHTSLAFAMFIFDRDYPNAEATFRRALEANAGYATAHHWYGEYLSAMGRLDEALDELALAKTLDPLSPAIRDSIGSTLFVARRYDEAIAELRANLETGLGTSNTYYYLGSAYAKKGMFREAAAIILARTEKIGPSAGLTALSGLVSAMAGDRPAAHRILLQLDAPSSGPLAPLIDLAYIYASLGERDRAFELLGKAEEAREPPMLWIRVDPMLDALRDDERFTALVQKLRLVP